MRVLHFYKTYYPDTRGGIEEVIFQIVENTKNYGVKSTVLSLSKNPSKNSVIYNDSHKAHKSKESFNILSTGISIEALFEFKKLLNQADIVHYHFPWPYMDFVHLISSVRKPTVLTYHSDILKQKKMLSFYAPVMYNFLDKIDCIVATSQNYLESSKVLNKYSYKTKIIPIGLSENNHYNDYDSQKENLLDNLPEKYFLFVGALRYYKGINILIDAMTISEFPLVIAGGGSQLKIYQKYAEDKSLKKIIFLGEVSNQVKSELLRKCAAIVFPSHLRTEAFGVTLVEGLMYGKPLISCEIKTGTSYVNLNGVTGFVINPNDIYSLHNAMTSLWYNEALSRIMGLAARQRYLDLFTGDKMGHAYFNLYQKLLG